MDANLRYRGVELGQITGKERSMKGLILCVKPVILSRQVDSSWHNEVPDLH